MKDFKIFKIPQIPNLVFTISKNSVDLLPQRLLCSSEFGFFWYYGSGRPLHLSDGMDYDFSVMKEYTEYILVQRLTINDPDIENWQDISYTLEEVERYFTVPQDKFEPCKFTKENICMGKTVLFANGEYGRVVNMRNSNTFDVILCNLCKMPYENCNLTQNYITGTHTWHEACRPDLALIHVL